MTTPEPDAGRVRALGIRVMLVQVITLIALWLLQARFAGG
jgi:hypothetical protein